MQAYNTTKNVEREVIYTNKTKEKPQEMSQTPNSLETFRRYIAEIPRKLRENYIYKVGIVYGEIAEQTHPVKFYFEQQEAMKDV